MDRLIDLIVELRQAPGTIVELSAAVGVRRETARLNINKLVKRGLVEFRGFEIEGKQETRGKKASKWGWKS